MGLGRSAAVHTAVVVANIQRGLSNAMTLEVGYVGSASVHLQRTVYANDSAPGGPIANRNLRRPWPDLGFIQAVDAPSHASYHSLQARLQQRFAHGFTLLAAYSFEKSIDDGSGIRQANGDSYVPSDGADLRTERGLSAFHFGQKFTASGLWQLPFGRGKAIGRDMNRFLDVLAGNWQLGGLSRSRAGSHFGGTAQNGAVYQNTDSTCRADATGITPKLSNPDPALWFDPAAFTNRTDFVTGVGPYRFGNSARNDIVGPGLIQVDASLFKSFEFSEKTELDFRAEFFNLPNHPNFGQPAATVGVAGFGRDQQHANRPATDSIWPAAYVLIRGAQRTERVLAAERRCVRMPWQIKGEGGMVRRVDGGQFARRPNRHKLNTP